ncbi:transposase [Coraliomargarita algicola]|uniref:Transposase n=2 Tax=Coraliomargarita algicola TaxID=3092156 RepID=A0ABZ0RH94_9BACT|nr:transposase [Coraliomargarita sp. J2-16]WPJ94878.1 transposase [Coraliomargarita sp. J2-16]
MTRTVNGERLFKSRDKEVLRKMIWQIADFSGVEVLTYCVMSNHFHVLVRVPCAKAVSDQELMRRFRLLYPKPTKYQEASAKVLESKLQAGGEEAVAIRERLLVRMYDVSEFMKTLKQRFCVWYNKSHERFGTLWAERFKSVLVEGKGNPLQTMAAYIDLNPVRAGLVEDPKDYRFCGYAEAVARVPMAVLGLRAVWVDVVAGAGAEDVLRAHRMLLFGKGACPGNQPGHVISREEAAHVMEAEEGALPTSIALRCRVRYFTDGAILGSAEFIRTYVDAWQLERGRKHPPKVNPVRGGQWGDLAVIQALRRQVFG